jgi:glycosyltransferase involved in cell wall biosynthesis
MNVLHVHSGNLFGGVETILTALARARSAVPGMQMSVALSFDGQVGRELRALGVETPLLGEVRLRRPDSVWRARRALAALLHREKVDVAVCHQAWPHAVFGPIIKRARVPLVVWVHMAQTRHWLERLAWRTRPDCIISTSRFTASTLPATGARVETIYPPVEAQAKGFPAEKRGTAPFSDASSEKGAVPLFSGRSSFDTSDSDVVIVQVSRMEEWKGQAALLEALGRLRDQRGWTLWMAGGSQRPREARYLQSLREAAERLGIAGRVRFLGHRTDVPALLNLSDIFCQPNLAPEPFGISLVEAMSAGLPVVTSAAGGALEIVNESCGVLVPAGDATALAVALARLIQDPAERQRLGRAGPSRAAELCDPAAQTRRFGALMKELA